VGAKSPLTGGIKEANSGGTAAFALSRQGIRALVLEGCTNVKNRPYLLLVEKGSAKLLDAEKYQGMSNTHLNMHLKERFGDKVSLITNGPAGEMKLAGAGISISDPQGRLSRFAARGGLGAVMGAKGVKAIVIRHEENYPRPKTEQFAEFLKQSVEVLQADYAATKVFPVFGTASMVEFSNTLGCLPTHNFTAGQFEEHENISGETLANIIRERGGEGKAGHRCMAGCLVRCSNIYADSDGKEVVSPLEYETIGMLGSNLGIGDLDAIAHMNSICNDVGLDTIETGAALGVAMEAGLIKFGDTEQALSLLREVEKGSDLGRLVGSGAVTVAKVYGVSRVPAVKGQAISAYDPRAVKGTGVTFATSPQGADHTAGLTIFLKIDHSKPDGQVEISRDLQISRAGIDSLGLCSFNAGPLAKEPGIIQGLLSSFYGIEVSQDILNELGRRVLEFEIRFNRAAGLGSAHDRLPHFMTKEKIGPKGLTFDISDKELDSAHSGKEN
jgi:aldehyde:ferredoxin oxidoreductase